MAPGNEFVVTDKLHGGGFTVIDNDCGEEQTDVRELSHTFTLNQYVPAVVGVPDIVPDVDNVSPGGNCPFSKDHL